MEKVNQEASESHMMQSPAVMKQLKELEEEQNSTRNKNTNRSTNEIQPMTTKDGINQ